MKKLFLLPTFILAGLTFGSHFTQAAELKLTLPSNPIYIGDEVELPLILDTQNETINAAEFHITLPEGLNIKQINSAGSILKLWVKDPSFNNNSFSLIGGIPYPGYQGSQGLVAKIIARADSNINAQANIKSSSQVLLSDGLGTKTQLTFTSPQFSFQAPPENHESVVYSQEPDQTPPTNLQISLGQSDTEYDGQWFITFSAEDNESGIAKYEVAEIPLNQNSPQESDWQLSKAPYILKNQNQNQQIFVKVTDNAGNFTIESIEFKADSTIEPAFLIAVIIITVLTIIFVIKRNQIYLWLKKIKSSSPS